MDAKLSCLCFSKDRPLQLEGYIRSLFKHSSSPVDLTVLFTTGDSIFDEAYEKLQKDFPSVRFVRESNFRRNVVQWLRSVKSEFVMFGCDDVVFNAPIDLALVGQAFAGNPELLCFSLRLGRSLNYCVTMERAMDLPRFLKEDPYLLWNWRDSLLDWGYPFELDCTIYRRGMIQSLLDAFGANDASENWGHPNRFEVLGWRFIVHATAGIGGLMASFPEAKGCVVTVNRVQDEAKNGVFDVDGSYSVETLLRLWNEGEELDIAAYEGRRYGAVHVGEMLLKTRDVSSLGLPGSARHSAVMQLLSSFLEKAEKLCPETASDPELAGYVKDFNRYFKMPKSEIFLPIRVQPQLGDITPTTTVDVVYFHQDTWCFSRALALRPQRIVDVGSTVLLVGMLACLAPTESIDIRPLPVSLPSLSCRKGSITEMPFADGSVEFLSSMCVIEHVGLGRYGDELDPEGSVKALRELCRVIKPGGHLVCSVPVAMEPFICFNAHRVFSRDYVLGFFPDFELAAEQLLNPTPVPDEALKEIHPFTSGVWCFDLRRKTDSRT